ncbi:hypothetical protein [Streptomyces sp. MBT27]|uniref:hypothetical protein n=1 Tax=Streptomyces sp. MBT27 TaxID=1488356 RepID=UPI001420C0AB|nr:hypothetical protein [Streptomyces sp. MBT27]
MNAIGATGVRSAVPRAALVAALLCAAVTGCGTARPGDPASVAPAAKPSATAGRACGGDTTSADEAPTDADPGTPGPPTDADPGTPGPPTDADPGTPGPPTDADPGTPGPPTDADPGTPGPPTDGTAVPCLPAGWFDMTRDFVDYYSQHLTKADDGMWPSIVAVRVRKERHGGAERAVVTVNFAPPPGASDWQGCRVAEVFADWRHAVYDDRGTLRVETRSGGLITDGSW